MLELVKELCQIDGVSGREENVRSYVKQKCLPYANEIREDAMGNLLVFKKGKRQINKTVLLTAHMDEVGIIIKSVTDEGYLKFAFVGGVDRRVAIGQRVFIGENRISGIIGLKAVHLADTDERKKIPKLEDMYIDVGDLKLDETKLVKPGDFGAFGSGVKLFGDGFIKAKALDDRVGCAVMLELIRNTPPVDTWFAFTVQEEVGARGAFGAAFSVAPDIALVIESTTAADNPGVSESKRVCMPGKGAVIPFMDRGTIYDRELFELLRSCAEVNGIPWQLKKAVAGGTDASSMQRSKAGVRVAAIAAAIRYIHSPVNVGCLKDFVDLRRLAEAFLEKLGDKYNA